jgi:hypothetical protein
VRAVIGPREVAALPGVVLSGCAGSGDRLLLSRLRLGLDFRLFGRGENRVQRGAFHAWHELDDAGLADVGDEAVDDLVAKVAVRHLAAFEAEAGLHLIAVGEKADGLVLLGLVVVLVDGDRELDFLDGDDLLLLAGGAFALVLLVEELSVVLNLADGRIRIGRDLDEVKRTLTSNFERVERRHDTELFAVFVNDANLASTDAVVGADEGLLRAFIEWRDRLVSSAPVGRLVYWFWMRPGRQARGPEES